MMDLKDRAAGLLLASEGYLSGENACRELGVTRAAFAKYVRALREEGWEIEAATNRGYKVVSLPDALIPAMISPDGREVRCFKTIDSTNIYAKRWAREGAAHGACVLSEEQTSGRGRRGRSWIAPAGVNLYMTEILRPQIPPEKAMRLTVMAALAAREAVERVSGVAASIKWPNDLHFNGKKLCGILLELSAEMDALEFVALGIGINVNQREFPKELEGTATSIIQECGEWTDRNALARSILCNMEALLKEYSQAGFDGILNRYRQRSCTLGKRVTVAGAIGQTEGVVEDFDEDGMVLLRKGDGTLVRIASGDVSLRARE